MNKPARLILFALCIWYTTTTHAQHFRLPFRSAELTCPAYLQKGDSVVIVSPAARVDKKLITRMHDVLTSWGLNVKIAPNAGSGYTTYAGTTAQRLQDLQEAMDNQNIKAIFCTRGGYGAIHLIEKIDFTTFRQYPKWVVGSSDITVLHALLQEQGFASIHAPMGQHMLDVASTDPALKAMRDMLFGTAQPYTVQADPMNLKGEAKGILRGGNLSVLIGLRGTPYDIPPQGTILFIEDVSERPHTIERRLYNLKLGGVLKNLSGLIVGQFSEYTAEDTRLKKYVYGVITDMVKEYGYPVCFDFPVGHSKKNMPLICGDEVELSVGNSVTLQFKTQKK